VTLLVALANGLIWIAYLNTPGEALQRGLAPIRQTSQIALALGAGHLLPVALLLITLIAPLPLAVPIAGLALIFGGAMQKYAFAFEGSAMRTVIRS
jgi:hypothetical protein